MSSIVPGNWYVTITCRHCGVPIAIGDAPSPDETIGPVETDHGPLTAHCNLCGKEAVYQPHELSIRQQGHRH